jgi:hypothetical protein
MEARLINFKTFTLFLSALLFIKCSEEKNTPNQKEKSTDKNIVSTKPEIIPPNFNADSALAFLQWMDKNGPRVPGTKAHQRFVEWAEQTLKKFGAETTIQTGNVTTHDGKNFILKNIIGSFHGERKERILLCSHYDSRPVCEKDPDLKKKNLPCPGINDGASGVAVLLEIARVLKEKDPGIGIDIIFFDLEDYGLNNGRPETWCLGSQYWSKNPHKAGYAARFGILLDMVGHKHATFPKEGYSMYYAPDITEKIWKTANAKGFEKYFINEEGPELTDDHYFINSLANIPCVDIIDYKTSKQSFFEHHHTSEDNLEKIDKNTLFAVGTTLLFIVYNP